jgi:hypothetical protein
VARGVEAALAALVAHTGLSRNRRIAGVARRLEPIH